MEEVRVSIERGKDIIRKRGKDDWQNGPNDKSTHSKEDGFECRFIDDVAAVKERANLGLGVGFSLEDMQRDRFSVNVVVVDVG